MFTPSSLFSLLEVLLILGLFFCLKSVPPYVPHQEINASADEKLECVLMRSDSEAVAVNLPDLEPIEKPTTVKWIDPTHVD